MRDNVPFVLRSWANSREGFWLMGGAYVEATLNELPVNGILVTVSEYHCSSGSPGRTPWAEAR
jgi:hypothetical protein